MGSIWSAAAPQAVTNPFATTGMAPSPGGGTAAKYQSMLQSSGKTAQVPGSGQSAAAATRGPNPADATSGSSDSSDSGATITANDFLTLLVTEMQNQDPTAQTDPNEYIDQLVQINSLEQLISINQNLGEVLGTASEQTTSATQSTGGVGSDAASATTNAAVADSAAMPSVHGIGSQSVNPGNLSVPKQLPAAHGVAHALDGHRQPAGGGHSIRDIPTRPIS
jgi:flagellar basal-body rod modification protein FlgD